MSIEPRHATAVPLEDPARVLDFVPPGADLIVPLANGEPKLLLDALDAHANELKNAAQDLIKAVKAVEARGFRKAVANLNAACNSCHTIYIDR